MLRKLLKRDKKNQDVTAHPDTTLEQGTSTLKEYLAPEGAIIEPDYVQLGSGIFMRSYSISHFPSSVFGRGVESRGRGHFRPCRAY